MRQGIKETFGKNYEHLNFIDALFESDEFDENQQRFIRKFLLLVNSSFSDLNKMEHSRFKTLVIPLIIKDLFERIRFMPAVYNSLKSTLENFVAAKRRESYIIHRRDEMNLRQKLKDLDYQILFENGKKIRKLI